MRYGVSRWFAAAATMPILLDAYQVQIEQNLMSETLFEALLSRVWSRCCGTDGRARGRWSSVECCSALSVPVRVVALPLIVPAVIFAFVCGPGGWRRLGRAAIVGSRFLRPRRRVHGRTTSTQAGRIGV